MTNTHDDSDDLLASSLPARTGPYRSLSAKRHRDPSNRKSVSFNDVPIVHEVPSYDTMRNSNSDIYRSWTFTETTSPISIISSFSSSQILSPFNSTSPAAQKLHANRLSSMLYSSSANRLSDWPIKTKTIKTLDETTDYNSFINVVHRPPNEHTLNKTSIQNETNNDDKKNLYRSPIIPDTEHYRNLPFTYVPLSESTTTYTSMISTNTIQANEQTLNGSTRTIRARSATLPITMNTNSSITRSNENISITPFRSTTNTISNNSSFRTVLKPATIAFHGSTNPTTNTIISKSPAIPPRSNSFIAHSRLTSASNRPLSSSNRHISSRSRSANVSSTKRQTTSPVVILDGSSGGTNSNNLSTTTKRNSNVRPTSSSSYIHHILLPANIN